VKTPNSKTGTTDVIAAHPTPKDAPIADLVPDFSAKDRQTLQTTLQTAMYDLVHLQLVVKHAHYNVVGPGFKPVHEFFDEIHEHVEDAADMVAERLVALGMSVEAQGPEVVKNTRVAPIPSGYLRDLGAIRLVAERVKKTAQDIRAGIEPLEDAEPVTADLLHGVVEVLEKDLWMLRAHLV